MSTRTAMGMSPANPTPCRLLVHPPATGAWNMAVDEMLLERAENRVQVCLRLYRWSEPTLSLGYFQDYAKRSEHVASRRCATVRRLTGGGAILHDAELTYSLVLPGSHPLATHRDELYRTVHGCLIETLASLGVQAELCPGETGPREAPEPFLCFQRRALGDVLVGEVKVCGSAQRRRNGAVLQHGSILWQRSAFAPELPGLTDLGITPVEPEAFQQHWLESLGHRLGFGWQPENLAESDLRSVAKIVEARYSTVVWTENRGRNSSRDREGRESVS